MKSVYIVCPTAGYIHGEAERSHIGIISYCLAHEISLTFSIAMSSVIHIAREKAAEYAQEKNFDYLFFLDSDMMPEPDIIKRLLDHDKAIVSGLAFKRSFPHEPCIFHECKEGRAEIYYDYPKGLVKVAGVGMACCLIRSEVLRNIEKPWFWPMKEINEDLAFCVRARQAGYDVYVDTNTICKHLAVTPIGEEEYLAARKAGAKFI